MLIRALDGALDLDRVLEMNNAAVPAVGALDRERLMHLVGQSVIALSVVATDGPLEGMAVGFCLVLAPGADYMSVNYRWFSERYDEFVYLDRVVVDERVRSGGIGAALYGRVDEQARLETTARWFCLEVNLEPRNDGSLRFHDRLGFVEVGRQTTDYGAVVSMQTRAIAR